jgi:drug/metabolite transporter (DMT)-like permease
MDAGQSHDAQLAREALRRSDLLRTRRRRRRKNSLLAGGVLAFCLFTAIVALQVQGMPAPMAATATAAPSLLADGVGGYVLAGVLGFILGVVLTALFRRYKKQK